MRIHKIFRLFALTMISATGETQLWKYCNSSQPQSMEDLWMRFQKRHISSRLLQASPRPMYYVHDVSTIYG